MEGGTLQKLKVQPQATLQGYSKNWVAVSFGDCCSEVIEAHLVFVCYHYNMSSELKTHRGGTHGNMLSQPMLPNV